MMKIVLPLMLTSGSIAHAATVEKDLGTSGSWKTAQIAGHDLWKKNACVSSTKATSGSAVLEFYAEQEGDVKGSYVEPTIQVVVKDATGFVRGTMIDDRSVQVQLTLATNKETKPSSGLLARMDDRKKAIEILRKGASVKVTLYNAKGKALKAYSFSMKGATKALDTAVAACKLTLP